MLGQQEDHIAAMTPRQSLSQTHVVTSSPSTTRNMEHDSNLTRQGDTCRPRDGSGSGLLLSEIACTGLPAFPFRLHDMLNDAEAKGFDHIVSWQIDGRSFKVHDKDQFSSGILPRYFQGQTRYKSFQRQRKFRVALLVGECDHP